MSDSERYGDLSDEQLHEIHRICDGFERSWRNNETVDLEEIVEQVSIEIQTALFIELLAIELEARFRLHQEPEVSEYQQRFPDHSEKIVEVFKEIVARTVEDEQAPTIGIEEMDPSNKSSRGAALSADIAAGFQIGPYRMVQPIGEGGMGSVWVAEQQKPVRRTVAVKIIKPGLANQHVISRFEAERQAIAMMDHPNIAQVLDAGTTDSGQPYFVMELVRGLPITRFCDEHRLDIRKRIELFQSVCNAVQHAHQKGIIHRDLKPSNILVADYDGKPVAKIIDFGLAKALHQSLTDETLHTMFGQVVGTLAYMSPEQSDINETDVDTRSDIYSLGVVLYELLTGSTPFDKQRLKTAAIDVVLRMIREEDPPRPSLRLSSEGSSAEVANSRATESKRLSGLIRGELDWIVMKALEKDRNRRYDTAIGFGRDLERFLNGEPVVAAPPSAAYLLRKFIKRNQVSVGTVSAIVASLLVGIAAFAWQAKEARDQRDLAVIAKENETEQRIKADEQRHRAEIAEADAKKRADELQIVSDFQAEMLEQIDATAAGRLLSQFVQAQFVSSIADEELTDLERDARADGFRANWQLINATDAARTIIDQTILTPSIEAIDEQFEDQPSIRAKLLQTVANIYRDIGLSDTAFPIQELAYEIRLEVLGEDDPETLYSLTNLGLLIQAEGRLDEAELYYVRSLEKRREVLGEEHPDTLISINNMGYLLQSQGKLDEAKVYYEDALEKRRRVLGDDDELTIASISNMGFLYYGQGKYDEAEPYWTETLERSRRVLGADHPTTMSAISNLGSLYRNLNRLDEAETLFIEALEKRREVLGEEHPETLSSLNNMGFLLVPQGRLDESEPYFRECLEKRRRVLGDNHPSTLVSVNNLGYVLREQGKFDEAEPLHVEALEKKRLLNGEDHPSTLRSMTNLAALYRVQRKFAEAESMLRDSLQRMQEVFGEDHPNTLSTMTSLAGVLMDQEKHVEATALARVLYEKRKATLEANDPNLLGTINLLGMLLQAQGDNAATVELLEPAEEATRTAFTGSNRYHVAKYLLNLGKARAAISMTPDQFIQSEANLIEAYEIFGQNPGPVPGGQESCAQSLVELYETWRVAEPDKGYDLKAKEWAEK